MSNSNPRAELIEARVLREEEWALEAFRARLSFPEMRRFVIRSPEEGGLGYAISESGLRALVASARHRAGDTAVTREERVERMQAEIDVRIRAARADLSRALGEREAMGPPDPYADKVEREIYWKKLEALTKTIESADRRLAAAQKDERDLHGLNAPTRIEADVTTRDGVLEDMNAALVALGREPVESA